MTRGRYPKKAIKNAKETAENRGDVRYCERGRGRHPHFSIVAPHMLAEVIMKPTKCIGASAAQLEQEAAAEIGDMKIYPVSQQISREIWFSSQNYFRRYFRITGTGIIELGPDGNLLPIDVAKFGAVGTTGALELPDSPVSMQFPAQEYPAVATPAPGVPAPGSSGPASPASVSSQAPENTVAKSSGPTAPAPTSSAATETFDPASPAPVSRRKAVPAPALAAESIPPRESVHT